MMWLDFDDGRVLGAPLALFPKLAAASADDREAVQVSRRGLHWDRLDEDLSFAGLLSSAPAFARAA